MSIITIGIDLAKTIFAVHGVSESGQAALVKPKVTREQKRCEAPLLRVGVERIVMPHINFDI